MRMPFAWLIAMPTVAPWITPGEPAGAWLPFGAAPPCGRPPPWGAGWLVARPTTLTVVLAEQLTCWVPWYSSRFMPWPAKWQTHPLKRDRSRLSQKTAVMLTLGLCASETTQEVDFGP